MATYTPKLNLKKPAGTEYVSRSDMNDNYDKIDENIVLDTNGEISNSLLIGTRESDTTVGTRSFAHGYEVRSTGTNSFSSGNRTKATGSYSHAEGTQCVASGDGSHAEGASAQATQMSAHAEGSETISSGNASHAEGARSHATGDSSHAEGRLTEANGNYSHSEGLGTTASNKSQHVGGEYNVEDTSGSSSTRGAYAEIIGNGANNSPSNARALGWDGNEYLMGDLYVGCNADSTNGKKIIAFPEPPATNGTYVLKATVSSGTITYSWVAE